MSASPHRSTATSASLPPLFLTRTATLAQEGNHHYCFLEMRNSSIYQSLFAFHYMKKKTDRFSNSSQCRDRLKPIHLSVKNSWTRWSLTLNDCYPIRANRYLSSSSYRNGVSRHHLFLKDWKSHRGRDVKLLCQRSNTSTGTDTNISFQSKISVSKPF